jgi:hypothetical protein
MQPEPSFEGSHNYISYNFEVPYRTRAAILHQHQLNGSAAFLHFIFAPDRASGLNIDFWQNSFDAPLLYLVDIQINER